MEAQDTPWRVHDAQIGVDGDVVGEVPGDDNEDGPAKETARTRTVCCDARRGAPCAAQAAVSSG
jgi:hypothetical protein